MTKEQKQDQINTLANSMKANSNFYLVDISGLDASSTMELRGECFKKGLTLQVVKNTFLKQVMDKVDIGFQRLSSVLSGNTAIIFTEISSDPAKLIKAFRKKGYEKPLLKAAYLEESEYLGEDQLELLSSLKSKSELISDIVCLLQSPARTVASQLQSVGGTMAGIIKSLETKEA